MFCLLEEEVKEYSHIPKRELERIFDSWDRARMKIMTKVPFGSLNKLLRKVDRHFKQLLKNYK